MPMHNNNKIAEINFQEMVSIFWNSGNLLPMKINPLYSIPFSQRCVFTYVHYTFIEKLKFSTLKKSGSVSIKESILREVNDGCTMYVSCSQVFPLLSTDMLLALSCNGDVIGKLWLLLSHSMSFKVNDAFQWLTSPSSSQSPLYSVLVLAIQVTQYFIA